MKITSMDVHRKEFGHAVRGYREDEVDDFLDAIAIELDRLQAQIEDLTTRAQQSESAALNFEAERNTINNALLTAQRASDDVLEQAKEKGKKLLEDANARAEKTLLAAKREKEELMEDIMHLKNAEEKFRAGILAHAEETIDQIREVKMPRVPARKEIPISMPNVEAVVESAAVADEAQDVLVEEAPAKPVAVPAPIPAASPQAVPVTPKPKPVTPTPPVAPVPQFKKEEGIGQFGEMEDDLDTID